MPDASQTRKFEFGPFRVDTASGELTRDGRQIKLFPQTAKVLLVLVTSGDRTVSTEELMQAVWGDTVVEEGSLTREVHLLRQALTDNPKEPSLH